MRLKYQFRTDRNQVGGVINPLSVHARVLTALARTAAAGIDIQYDEAAIEVVGEEEDQLVTVEIDWPEGTRKGQAWHFINDQFLTFDSLED